MSHIYIYIHIYIHILPVAYIPLWSPGFDVFLLWFTVPAFQMDWKECCKKVMVDSSTLGMRTLMLCAHDGGRTSSGEKRIPFYKQIYSINNQ